MSQLAVEHNAINLAQGFPDFEVDHALLAPVQEKWPSILHQYAPMAGYPDLLEQIAAMNNQLYHQNFNAKEEVLITAGATQGIFTAIQAFVHARDEVVVLDPCYDCYVPAVQLASGVPIRVSLGNDFKPNWQAIENAITLKTRMIIINNPHNPSGAMWEKSDFEQLDKCLSRNPNMLVLSDEVYEHISFESPFYSVKSMPHLKNRMIAVSSFGKTLHVTGWKLGYVIAARHLMGELKKVHQYLVFSVNSVGQHLLRNYLPSLDFPELSTMYREKRDLFRELLQKSRLKLLPCEGTYFQLADYSAISDLGDVEFCRWLVEKHGVAAIPISVFYADGKDRKIIRFCFAKKTETLIESSKKLCQI